jgi:hypothetical protein
MGGELSSCKMADFLGVTSSDLIFSYKRKNNRRLATNAYDNLLDLHEAQSSVFYSSSESSFCQTEDLNAPNFFIRVKNNIASQILLHNQFYQNFKKHLNFIL